MHTPTSLIYQRNLYLKFLANQSVVFVSLFFLSDIVADFRLSKSA
jgi:hypothetical protein